MFRRRGSVGLVLAPIVAVGVAAGVARGQEAEMRLPPYLSAERFEECLNELQLDDSSQSILRLVYVDLVTETQQRANEVRLAIAEAISLDEAYQAAHDGQSPWLFEGEDFGTHLVWRDWRVWRRLRQAEFEQDVAVLLSDEGEEIWRQISQSLRRERCLPEMNDLYGRRMPDLVAAVDEMRLSPQDREELAGPLAEYRTELDGVLKQWEASADDLQLRILSTGIAANDTESEARRKRDPHRTASKQFYGIVEQAQDTTRRFGQVILSQMPIDRRRTFLERTAGVMYPEVYIRSPIDVLVQQLRQSEIDGSRMQAIETLYSEYMVDCDVNGDLIVEALYRWEHPTETKFQRRVKLREQLLREGEYTSLVLKANPVLKHLYSRRELTRLAVLRIRSMYTDVEIENLPPAAQFILGWVIRESPTG